MGGRLDRRRGDPVDIGGYVFGRLIGGPRLMPRVSPNKTWPDCSAGSALQPCSALF